MHNPENLPNSSRNTAAVRMQFRLRTLIAVIAGVSLLLAVGRWVAIVGVAVWLCLIISILGGSWRIKGVHRPLATSWLVGLPAFLALWIWSTLVVFVPAVNIWLLDSPFLFIGGVILCVLCGAAAAALVVLLTYRVRTGRFTALNLRLTFWCSLALLFIVTLMCVRQVDGEFGYLEPQQAALDVYQNWDDLAQITLIEKRRETDVAAKPKWITYVVVIDGRPVGEVTVRRSGRFWSLASHFHGDAGAQVPESEQEKKSADWPPLRIGGN